MPEIKSKPKTKATPKAAPRKKKVAAQVLYSEPSAVLYVGKNALTIAQAKELLGWEEEPDGESWGSDCNEIVSAIYGRKVRLKNNLYNRPIILSALRRYIQDRLQGKWPLNLDSLVIGLTGQIMSGQHRLLAFILAEVERLANIAHWGKFWPEELRMECLIGYGVEESDEVFRTLNAGAVATVADTLYRSTLLASVPMKDRIKAAKIVERSVGMLWDRLGYKTDQWTPVRTISEAYDFVSAHPTILECALEIIKENSDAAITELHVSTGAAASLMYLMAVSDSSYEEYHHARALGKASEKKHLTLTRYEAAQSFWQRLSNGDEQLQIVRDRLHEMSEGKAPGYTIIQQIVRAWELVQAGEEINTETLDMVVRLDPATGVWGLVQNVTCGGPDNGIPVVSEIEESEEEEEVVVEEEAPAPKLPKWKRSRKDIDKVREKFPEHLLVFEGEKECTMYGEHAFEAGKLLVIDPVDTPSKLKELTFPAADLRARCADLAMVGKKVAIVDASDFEKVVEFKDERKSSKKTTK